MDLLGPHNADIIECNDQTELFGGSFRPALLFLAYHMYSFTTGHARPHFALFLALLDWYYVAISILVVLEMCIKSVKHSSTKFVSHLET